jgi:hypothetical protein
MGQKLSKKVKGGSGMASKAGKAFSGKGKGGGMASKAGKALSGKGKGGGMASKASRMF